MRRIYFTMLLFYFGYVAQLQSQSIDKALINNFINKTLEDVNEIPGLAVTVVSGNNILFEKTYGFADVENKIKTTPDTPYYIASATKSFVGLLAVLLEEEGILELDAPISNYAPIKNLENKSIFDNITVSDLLSHQLGIRNNVLTFRYASDGTYSEKELIAILENRTSRLYNNKRFKYDNLGYNIFDLILSEEFGLNWKDELKKRVFSPLDMTHTSTYISDVEKNNWKIALPYTSINEQAVPTLAKTRKNDKTFQAAGGLVCSINDA